MLSKSENPLWWVLLAQFCNYLMEKITKLHNTLLICAILKCSRNLKSSLVGAISAILQLSYGEDHKIALYAANLCNFEMFLKSENPRKCF